MSLSPLNDGWPAHTHSGQHPRCLQCGTYVCTECTAEFHGDCLGGDCQCGCEVEE